VKIFYRLCEDTTVGLVHFPETPTGGHLTDIVERSGICTMNTKTILKPLGFCKGNGMSMRIFVFLKFYENNLRRMGFSRNIIT
jgi:hypothetical protein